jgi:cellulose synthase (UDP-forming)
VELEPATQVVMKIKEIGAFPATVLQRTPDGILLALGLENAQYQALLRRLYAAGNVPSVTATRLSAIIGDATARIMNR